MLGSSKQGMDAPVVFMCESTGTALSGAGHSIALAEVEITRNRFMLNIIVKNITIDTEAIQSEDGKTVNVSSMEILLAKT